MSRLPIPGQDAGQWGTILNDFLSVEHNADGSLKASGSLAGKATDSAVVHLAGTETITGTKHLSKATFKNGPWLDVTHPDFAADNTGATDATAAITAAIAYAVSHNINTVYLPEGTYKITPASGTGSARTCFVLPAGLKRLKGAGADLTKLRVADNVGDYYSIIRTGGDLSGLEIEDLTFDQNTTNNVPSSTGLQPPYTYPRIVLQLSNSTSFNTIRRVRFADSGNINTCLITARNNTIQDCRFEYSGAELYDHDHSAIYINSATANTKTWIINNTLTSPGAGTMGARTAIETHGMSQEVRGNLIFGYQKGMNITGIGYFSGEGIRVTDNQILDAKFGMELWSTTYHGNITGLRNAHITGNQIRLYGMGWAPMFSGSGSCSGIFIDTAADLPIEDVCIDYNDIVYDNSGGYVGLTGESTSNAIEWRRNPNGSVVDSRVHIRFNTIVNAQGSGIRWTTNGDSIDISGNTIKNPGQGTVAAGGSNAISNGYGNGIFVTATLTNSRVDNNLIIDNQGSPTTTIGLSLWPSAGSANNQAIGNRVPVALSKKLDTVTTAGSGWLVRMDQETYSALTGKAVVGSEIRDISTGLIYRQTASPDGTTWSAYTPGLADAAAGTASLRTLGTGANQAAAGNDSRFTAIAPLASPPKLSATFAPLSGRPYAFFTGTGTFVKDQWRYIPLKLEADMVVDQLAVFTTTAASGGTAALIFGLFQLDSSNRPGVRQADWSTYGSIDLTPAPAALTLTTASLTIPAGEWYLGLAWSGTATTNPVFTTLTGMHPQITSGSPASPANAYFQSVSGASVPASALASTNATVAPVVWGKLH